MLQGHGNIQPCGLFWYSWLWHLLRPLLIALCVVLVVAGVVMTGYNWIDRHFFAPMDAQDQTPVSFTVASGSSLTIFSDISSSVKGAYISFT